MAETAIAPALSAARALGFWETLREKADQLLGADLRALAAFRIALAAVLLCDLAMRAQDLTAFYSDDGMLSRRTALSLLGEWDLSLHLLGGSPGAVALLFAVHLAAALAMLLGVRTRLATALAWALTVSLQNRNILLLQGADDLLRLLLFWSLFLPLSARWSLDALRAQGHSPPRRVLSAGTAAILLQVAFVYWFTYVHKYGWEWADGSSVYWALANDHFGRAWAQQLILPHAVLLRGLSRSVYAFEFWGPTLLFFPLLVTPLRLLCVAGFFALHLGMGASLNLSHFPFVSSVAMLPFIPTAAWDWLAARSLLQRPAEKLRALCGRLAARLPARPLAWRPRALPQLGALFLLGYVFVWNAGGLENAAFGMPDRLEWIGNALSVDQKWNMFAPGPARDSGWYVLPGKLEDGTALDLFPALQGLTAERPVSFEKPAHVASTFKSVRWLDYLSRVKDREDDALFQELAGYLCVQWNARHQGGRQLESFEIVFVGEPTVEPGESRPVEQHLLWQHSCI